MFVVLHAERCRIVLQLPVEATPTSAESTILESIARHADASTVSNDSGHPRMVSISEVGMGVEDVLGTVAQFRISAQAQLRNLHRQCQHSLRPG